MPTDELLLTATVDNFTDSKMMSGYHGCNGTTTAVCQLRERLFDLLFSSPQILAQSVAPHVLYVVGQFVFNSCIALAACSVESRRLTNTQREGNRRVARGGGGSLRGVA